MSRSSRSRAVRAGSRLMLHVFSGALASFAGMLILSRMDLKIDQRLLNTSGKPKEEKRDAGLSWVYRYPV